MSDLRRSLVALALFAMLGCTYDSSGQEIAAAAQTEELRVFLLAQGYVQVPMTRLATGHYSISGLAEEVTLDLIVDTGASHTLLDIARVDRFGIRTGDTGSQATGLGYSNQSVETGRLANVEVGVVRIDTMQVTIVDLSQVNRVLDGMGDARVDGILGSDALTAWRAVIDYGSRSLYLME